MNFGEYNVKEVQVTRGDATNGYTAKLFKGSKPIAMILDYGNGDPATFQWLEPKAAKEFVRYVRQQPAEPSGFNIEPWGTEWDMSLFVAGLVDQHDFEMEVAEECQTKTVYRLKGDEPNTCRTLNHPYDHRSRKHLEDMYPDTLEEILNERQQS